MTALRWQKLLRELGHRTRIIDSEGDPPRRSCDLLIAIHAGHSAELVRQFKERMPNVPLVIAVTGTDIYRDGRSARVQRTLKLADRVIVLQPEMKFDLPPSVRKKVCLIYQSVEKTNTGPVRKSDHEIKRVVVAGHLRRVKDPLRAALSVRNLPASSRIFVDHFGGTIEKELGVRAKAESKRNPRYRWHGEVARTRLRKKLAAAWLLVQSSRTEGGASAVSEAIVDGVPVLATRIAGNVGLLGRDYAGYFAFGKTAELKQLLLKCERDVRFYRKLKSQIKQRAGLFTPARELKTWEKLLKEVCG